MTELQDSREERRQERQRRREERRQRCANGAEGQFGIINSRSSNLLTGLFILAIGVLALMRTSIAGFPRWAFGWEILLLAFGLFIGLRHNFRGGAWLVLVLVGGIFLLRRIYPAFSFNQIWPVVLIVIGLFIILRPRRGWKLHGTKKTDGSSDSVFTEDIDYSKDDFVESTSIFGGAKKIVISKNFKGGTLENIFGGTELDLSQADFTGTAVIELTTIFGGTKLLVPSNWSVKSEAVTIFGGIEDKRRMQTVTEASEKTLLIRGTVIFGGIDIKSF
ncbi:MAG TPA: LiaF domain-containing protein [Chitinophagaceae bacterium]|nr:LiaF domain-containing protein [Chitinophagaceae bacterium]